MPIHPVVAEVTDRIIARSRDSRAAHLDQMAAARAAGPGRAAGIQPTWVDFDDLSGVTPLIVGVYSNGSEDVNAFQAAGGGPRACQREPFLKDGRPVWREGPAERLHLDILRPVADPFQPEGGPQANAMPELHSLAPTLAVPLERGLKVARAYGREMLGWMRRVTGSAEAGASVLFEDVI